MVQYLRYFSLLIPGPLDQALPFTSDIHHKPILCPGLYSDKLYDQEVIFSNSNIQVKYPSSNQCVTLHALGS